MLRHYSCVRPFVTLWTVTQQAPLSWDSPGKNTGVGCHALLQGIFPTQGLNLHLLCPALAGGFFTTSATWEARVNPALKPTSKWPDLILLLSESGRAG